LKSLLEDPAFTFALSYISDDQFDGSVYSDVLNGKSWRQNKADNMSNIFHNYKQRLPDEEAKDIEDVSLCLSLIFDGVQLFKRKMEHCWPLGFTIQSLPPHLRGGKLGLGTYLISISQTMRFR
jgi:hypothetical protein